VPQFLPFPGIRYGSATPLVDVVAPPYDVIEDDARAALEAADPRNSVRLILPRDDGPMDRYQRAAELFRTWLADGTLVVDSPRFYRYRMTYTDDDGRPRHTIGVIGALELSPPGVGDVLPHERTMPKPKGDRLELLRTVRANLDPVWGLTLAPLTPELTTAASVDATVVAHCADVDGVEHEVSAIDDPDRQAAITALVGSAPLVIADGHHRYETALTYRAERVAAGIDAASDARILAFVVELAEDELLVRPIHRLLRGLPIDVDLRDAVRAHFTVEAAGPNTPDDVAALRRRMAERGGLGLVDHAGLAVLRPRADTLAEALAQVPDVVRAVDATICDVGILSGLTDVEVSYRNDALTVAALVAKGDHDAAVLLRPVTVGQIHAAADAGERMPEKTTFFAPKPRTGLVFRSLDEPEPDR